MTSTPLSTHLAFIYRFECVISSVMVSWVHCSRLHFGVAWASMLMLSWDRPSPLGGAFNLVMVQDATFILHFYFVLQTNYLGHLRKRNGERFYRFFWQSDFVPVVVRTIASLVFQSFVLKIPGTVPIVCTGPSKINHFTLLLR